MPPDEAAKYVVPTYLVNSDSPEVQQFVARALRHLPDGASRTDKAVRLFEAVRDGIRYDPYTFALTVDAYRASTIARSEEHTSELQSLMRISYAVFCLKK